MGRSRYRRRHPPRARRRRPPGSRPRKTTDRLLAWGTAVPIVIFVFWFFDTRSGLLRPHGSPLLALLIDVVVIAIVVLAVAARGARR
jgi:hypothetical protein